MPSMYRRMHRRKIEVTESHYQIAIVVLVTLLLLLGALHTHQKLRITAHEDDWALKLLAGVCIFPATLQERSSAHV